jgi:hypothetical protein
MCVLDADCDDDDECTTDVCHDGWCVHVLQPGCSAACPEPPGGEAPPCTSLDDDCAVELERLWDEAAKQWTVSELNINGGHRKAGMLAGEIRTQWRGGLGTPAPNSAAGLAWKRGQCAWERAAEQCRGVPRDCAEYAQLYELVSDAAEGFAEYNALVGRPADEFWGVAQVARYPSNACLFATMAFEDTRNGPDDLCRRDEDYNDWVALWHAVELFDEHKHLCAMSVDVRPRARGSWFEHTVHWAIDGAVDTPSNLLFETRPLVRGAYSLHHGVHHFAGCNETSRTTEQSTRGRTGSTDITVFNATHDALAGYVQNPQWEAQRYINTLLNETLCRAAALPSSVIVVTPMHPSRNAAPRDRPAPPGVPDYYFYLHSLNTRRDITYVMYDLESGCVFNAEDALVATGVGDGFEHPTGFIVEGHWRWPVEFDDIEAVYPGFTPLREWLTAPGPLNSAELDALARWWHPQSGAPPPYPACGMDAPLP